MTGFPCAALYIASSGDRRATEAYRRATDADRRSTQAQPRPTMASQKFRQALNQTGSVLQSGT